MGSRAVGSSPLVSHTAFRHEAFLYRDRAEFLDGTAAFIRDAVDRDDPILVVVDEVKIDTLRSTLDTDADRVQFADMATVGRNPARIIPAWQQFVQQHSQNGQPIRGIGEPTWAGRSPAELDECRHHEALLNLAFGHVPGFWLLCPYDTTSLAPAVVEQARGTHPHVHPGNGHQPNDRYHGVDQASLLAEPLPDPPNDAAVLVFGSALATVRRFAADLAVAAGWHDESTDVALVVGELAANSLRYGGGGGTLHMWQDDGALVSEVRDDGRLADALVGRRRPVDGQLGGRGLWLVNQLCDLVQIRSSAAGTIVRTYVGKGSPARASRTGLC
jgi:anti-sigma regulatory factor (Ser/Thr protein kinase)